MSIEQIVGRTLGEYQIERLLGQGQLGAVYLGQQKSGGHAVTITTFNFPAGITAQAHESFSARFAHEGAILTRLDHPNILLIYAYGEQADYAFMITSFVKAASLSQALKQQGRFTPEQTLSVLKQVAAALDYAHGYGVVHAVLSLANILVINKQQVQIAGFGLKTLLDLHGNTQLKQLPAHLLNANGKFLGSPESISPERVLGLPADARSDIYSLGTMLFELLCGTPPFSGTDSLEMALKRIEQPAPSLHMRYPEIPETLALVVNKALERDPSQRYRHAGELATAFEHALQVATPEQAPSARTRQVRQDTQITMPPTVNWFDEDMLTSRKWQAMQPADGGNGSVVAPQAMPEKPIQPTQADVIPGVDPFALWSATSAKTEALTPGMFTRRPTVSLSAGRRRPRPRPAQADRRRLVKLIVVGTVTAGVIGAGGISFAHFMQSVKQVQSRVANAPATGPTQTTQGNAPATGPTQGTQNQNTPTAGKTPTAQPSSTQKAQPSPTAHATQQPTPKPTQPPPTPTPKPPSHTGTVIGYTSQATNSAKSFSNPADGQGSLLIRLPNGNFVACERACTHVGVAVNYDSGSHQLLCPAHGAIFDPPNGFSHVSGSGPSGLNPLPQVSIRVNGDGTITTG
ncbi:MAG: Rieske 2Fe-2S domain-containing protein [Chloroflexi bacterium]|nr:MAG: Rieske 2Fe-2S domain-containing protein [Chloroflexota bacterium]